MKQMWSVAIALIAFAGTPAAVQAQISKGPALRLQVVFERYEKDKKISSVPYSVTLVARAANESFDTPSRLHVGLQVPMNYDTLGPEKRPVPGNVVYKDVGDRVDCSAAVRDDGRFLLRCVFEQASIATTQGPAANLAPPLLRTFRSEASLVIGEGQTVRHSAGVDRTTGETVNVDVTLTAIK